MPISFDDGTAWRTAVDVWVNVAGTWQRVKQAYRNDGSAWRLVHQISTAAPGTPGAPALAATASPANYSRNALSNNGGGSFSQAFTGSPSGGSGSYTTSWTRIAQGGSPASSSISGNVLTLSGTWARYTQPEYSETWQFSVTDNAGGAVQTFNITLNVDVENGQ